MMGAEGKVECNTLHEVHVDLVHMDGYEVTNAEHTRLCEATGRRIPDFGGVQ